jgi:hypothetical protein
VCVCLYVCTRREDNALQLFFFLSWSRLRCTSGRGDARYYNGVGGQRERKTSRGAPVYIGLFDGGMTLQQ